MSTPDCNADMDTATLPEFLRKGPPGLQPSREPHARPRAVAINPPAPEPVAEPREPPEQPLAVLERHIRRIIAEERRQNEARRNRLAEIASLVGSLTYGEMIELAEAIWSTNAGVELTQEALPAAFHRWSETRK